MKKKETVDERKVQDEIQGHSHRLRRRTFGAPYVLLIFSLSHACQCGSLCLEHLQFRLLCSLVVIVIDVCAISVTVTCFETLCERETPRVPKHYAKRTHVKCSLLIIGLTSDQAESIEALGNYIWEEKLRVLEVAITLHLARSFYLFLTFAFLRGEWAILDVAAGFVPAFEKIGKTCHVYLTRVHITLLHNVLNADGVQAVAQFSRVLHSTPLFVITLLCFSAQLCLLQQI